MVPPLFCLAASPFPFRVKRRLEREREGESRLFAQASSSLLLSPLFLHFPPVPFFPTSFPSAFPHLSSLSLSLSPSTGIWQRKKVIATPGLNSLPHLPLFKVLSFSLSLSLSPSPSFSLSPSSPISLLQLALFSPSCLNFMCFCLPPSACLYLASPRLRLAPSWETVQAFMRR